MLLKGPLTHNLLPSRRTEQTKGNRNWTRPDQSKVDQKFCPKCIIFKSTLSNVSRIFIKVELKRTIFTMCDFRIVLGNVL